MRLNMRDIIPSPQRTLNKQKLHTFIRLLLKQARSVEVGKDLLKVKWWPMVFELHSTNNSAVKLILQADLMDSLNLLDIIIFFFL